MKLNLTLYKWLVDIFIEAHEMELQNVPLIKIEIKKTLSKYLFFD